MKETFRNEVLWIGLTAAIMIGTGFFVEVYQAFWGDRNIWWTHQDMKLGIEQTKDTFELYVAGSPLEERLKGRDMLLMDEEGVTHPLAAKDITVRLNNWNKHKADLLTHTTVSGFLFGVAVALLALGLIQSFNQRKRTG